MKHILATLLMTLSAGLARADLVYAGSQGNQISALRFDPANGQLTAIGPVAQGLRPSWTTAHPQLPVLYAVDDDNARDGKVVAYAIDRDSGALRKMNEAPTGGNGATYLWLDAPSNTLLASNFAGGSTSSIAVNADGSLGALASTIKVSGSGPHRRQSKAHEHSTAVDPSGHYVLAPDLGADRVFIYALDRDTHTLSQDDGHAYATPPGSGPRHLVFGKDGHYVYLLNELTAEIMTLRWDAQQGKLSPVQTLQTSSAEFAGTRSGAEIAISRDGRYVYASDRGENRLLVYSVNPASGELALLQRVAGGGELPWSFTLHPSGRWMLVANQRSGTVNVFSIDAATGLLKDSGISAPAPTPVSLTIVP